MRVSDTIEKMRDLMRMGLSDREVISRTGLTQKEIYRAIHRGELTPEKAAQVEQRLESRKREESDIARTVGPHGHMITVETTNITSERLLRRYMEAVQAFAKGDDPYGTKLKEFEGKTIKILGPAKRPIEFVLVTDKNIIRDMADRGELKQSFFGGEAGS